MSLDASGCAGLPQLEVNNLGALLLRIHTRGLRAWGAPKTSLVMSDSKLYPLKECDGWSASALDWIRAQCWCEVRSLAFTFDLRTQTQATEEMVELARTTFLASHNVYRANAAISPQAAAAVLGWSVERLRALEAAGEVRTVRRGDARWVPCDEVERLREPVTMTLDEVDALLARCAKMR